MRGTISSHLCLMPGAEVSQQAERALVEANRKLIEVFEKKIQAKLAEIWGEE